MTLTQPYKFGCDLCGVMELFNTYTCAFHKGWLEACHYDLAGHTVDKHLCPACSRRIIESEERRKISIQAKKANNQ